MGVKKVVGRGDHTHHVSEKNSQIGKLGQKQVEIIQPSCHWDTAWKITKKIAEVGGFLCVIAIGVHWSFCDWEKEEFCALRSPIDALARSDYFNSIFI